MRYLYVCQECGNAYKCREFILSEVTLLMDPAGPAGKGIVKIFAGAKSCPFTKLSKEEFLAERLLGREEMDLLCSDSCCIKYSERFREGLV